MILTKRMPSSVGDILREEYLEPLGISNTALAEAMGVHRNTVSNILSGKEMSTDTAIRLSIVFDNTPDFWLNIQHRRKLWEANNMKENQSITGAYQTNYIKSRLQMSCTM